MPLTDEDLTLIRRMIRDGIEDAFSAMFTAVRLENFGGLMTAEVESRVRDALANIECNSEKV